MTSFLKEDTKIINKCKSGGSCGALSIPVYRSSTLIFDTVEDYVNARLGNSPFSLFEDQEKRDCGYSSAGTQTYQNLTNLLCTLESKDCSGLLYPNGLIALTSTLLTFAKTGDHILIQDNCYNMLKYFAINHAIKMGIEVEFFDPTKEIDNLLKKNTSIIMLENPGSHTFEISDIDKIVESAKKRKIITAIDNSWGGPMFFKPLEYGIDISLYSVTKYLNGHSDILMGSSFSKGEIFRKMNDFYFSLGITVSPDDCYMVHRGIKTLKVRLDKQQKTAIQVANTLSLHKLVSKVLCPALPEHPQHELWKKYFTGISSLFSFVLTEEYTTKQLSDAISKMSVFSVGASWGGCESIIMPCIREKINLAPRQIMSMEKGSYIRIFCGLEDPEDLINDLNTFLDHLWQNI